MMVNLEWSYNICMLILFVKFVNVFVNVLE